MEREPKPQEVLTGKFEKEQQGEFVQKHLETIFSYGKISRENLASILTQIEYSKQSRPMNPAYKMEGKNVAAECDWQKGRIVLFPEYFSEKHQEHILAHEIGEAILRHAVDFSKYREMTVGRKNDYNSEYVYQIEDPELKIAEAAADDLADYLRSRSPEDMLMNRLERIPPERVKALSEDPTALLEMKGEVNSLYQFFEQSIKNREFEPDEYIDELEREEILNLTGTGITQDPPDLGRQFAKKEDKGVFGKILDFLMRPHEG